MLNEIKNLSLTEHKKEFILYHKPDFLNRDRRGVLDSLELYYSWKKVLPNIIEGFRIDIKCVMKWMETNFRERIIHKYFTENYIYSKSKSKFNHIVYFMEPDLLFEVDSFNNSITIMFQKKYEKEARYLMKNCPRKKSKDQNNLTLGLITSSNGRLGRVNLKVPKLKIDILKNYNDDLASTHLLLLKGLRAKNRAGLVLLHGKPGTGKSTYLKFLLSQVKKDVVLLSPKIMNSLDHPEMIDMLIDMEKSIFVVEDAEELITSRDGNRSSNIAWLLNLTDGLLGDSLKIKVICTFNTSLKNVDEALLRKGRLIARYEFNELGIEKSIHLLKKLGTIDPKVNLPMTLADIYNFDKNNFRIKQSPIGFTINKNEI